MKKQLKHKIGIRRKIRLIIISSMFIILTTGIGIGYYSGFKLLHNTIVENHLKIAETLSLTIDRIIEEEVADLNLYVSLPSRINELEKNNLKYEEMDPDSIRNYFTKMDEIWNNPNQDNLLIINEYLDTLPNKRIREVVEKDRGIAEIIITDRFGGLVMSSDKTTDFYQADESWWVQGFNKSKGKTFISNIEYDESSNTLALPLVIPVKNNSGKIIGIAKAVLDVNRLFFTITNFSIGKTGYAILINEKGDIISRIGVGTINQTIKGEWLKIFKKEKGSGILHNPIMNKNNKVFITYSAINKSFFLNKDAEWKVSVIQDVEEVFSPLNNLIIQLITVSFILLIIMILLSNFFSKIFIVPITKLHEATDIVAKGNLDYTVEIKTNDEIEQFADSFNIMVKKLKESTASISDLNKEIAKRISAEKKLESEKNIIDIILKTTPSAIFTVDKNRIITSWNNRAEIITGYSAKEVIGKDCSLFALEPCSQVCGFLSEEIIKPLVSKECTIKRKDGQIRIILKNVDFIKDESNNIIGGIESFDDITDLKNYEREIIKASQEWQRTFDSISDFIFIQDIDNTILKANKSFCELLGLKPKDIIGKKCYELIHKLGRPWPNCPFEKTKSDKMPHTEEVMDHSNIGIPLLVTTSPIFDDKYNLIGNVHIAKDITEIKKTEKKLKEIAQMKSQFTSMVSHELRTPLGPIKEGASIILDGIVGEINEKQRDLLNTVKNNADRLNRLINNVLDFQKLESGKMIFNFEKNNIKEVIDEAYKTMVLAIKGKDVNLTVDIASNIPEMQFDRDKILQVIINLLSNAIKFTDKGSVQIKAIREENNLHLMVIDTGPGIKQEDLPKLFQSFQQLDIPGKRKEGGSGLGLAISKEIIIKHNGKIWVESEIGKGSTFHFFLPIV
ncbi:MAG: PAS domain S-box protein [Candidatus Omnitrophica bacterium]|nr:PAS domain S-box protein [Candidatus Omnitrophota bacterium]